MRAYRMQENAGRLQLALQDVPRPEPGPGQLLLRVRAAGLNRGEFIAGRGLHGSGPDARPVGTEAAGEVVSVGPGMPAWRPGDRAMGRARGPSPSTRCSTRAKRWRCRPRSTGCTPAPSR